MTIAGTIPLVLCIFLWLMQKENFLIRFGMRLLKFSIFFYLIPIQLLYYILPNSVYYFFKFWYEEKAPLSETIRLYPSEYLILDIRNQYIWLSWKVVSVAIIWFLCVIIFASIQIRSYMKLINTISHCTTLKAKESQIHIVVLDNLHSPYSVGFFKTYIVLPKALLYSDYKEVLYKHEYCHIKNHDTWMKLFCLVIICLHFYNPFSYILLLMYNTLCEYLCDIYAIGDLDINKRKEYARLLVEISSDHTPLPVVWRNGFSAAKFNMKRRIMYIMKREKSTSPKKIVSILLSVITVFISAFTTWAYAPLKNTNWNPEEYMGDNETIEFFSPKCVSDSQYYVEEENVDFSVSNIVLKLGDNTYIALPIVDSSIKKVSCIHSFQTKYLYEHNVKNNGGCSIKKYKAQICSKCSYIKNRVLEYTTSYPKCPHK